MTFEPMKTDAAVAINKTKTLIYANGGWGKTKQASFYQKMFGPGFVISGESGLLTLAKDSIDYLPFSRWDDDSAGEGLSFKGIAKQMMSADFKAMNYRWIMTDSLTEVADLCFAHFNAKNYKNTWDLYGDYGGALLGAVKWFRDLPYHVIVTSLVKEDRDINGQPEYWPMLKGNVVQRQICGIFDNVLGGIAKTRYAEEDELRLNPITDRYIVTDHAAGWMAKVRTPYPERVRAIERAEKGIPYFIRKMLMNEAAYKKYAEIEAAVKAGAPYPPGPTPEASKTTPEKEPTNA